MGKRKTLSLNFFILSTLCTFGSTETAWHERNSNPNLCVTKKLLLQPPFIHVLWFIEQTNAESICLFTFTVVTYDNLLHWKAKKKTLTWAQYLKENFPRKLFKAIWLVTQKFQPISAHKTIVAKIYMEIFLFRIGPCLQAVYSSYVTKNAKSLFASYCSEASFNGTR